MGMQLSESTNKTGLFELFQDLTKTNPTSYPLYKFARDANNALGTFNMKALMASQKMEHDDSNQTDYPIITMNIVSGQIDYPFSNDASTPQNQILDILRIELASPSGVFNLLTPFDLSEKRTSMTQDSTASGTPTKYDKFGNALWFDVKPNYNYTGGIKIYFGRTPFYFIGDGNNNSVKPGIPDPFHEYMAYVPAYNYCVINKPNLAAGYLAKIQQIEALIDKFYFFRNKDERKAMKANVEKTK